MKDELNAVETYVKELEALKRYDEAKRLNQEVSELKTALSQVQAERDKLKGEISARQKAEEEARQLKEALKQAQTEASMLKETKAVLKERELTLEEAAQEFVKASEAEIKTGVEREFEGLRKNFEASVPQLVYDKLLAILKEPEWPTEIARVIDNVAEEKAQSRLDDEFERRVNEGAWRRFQEFKRTEWQPFLEAEASRIGFNLKTLVAELQGIWHFDCDRCQRRVTMDIGSRQIASLLRGEQVAECPQCKDFNLPPAAPIAPHKIKGSALADMVEAYVAGKGPP